MKIPSALIDEFSNESQKFVDSLSLIYGRDDACPAILAENRTRFSVKYAPSTEITEDQIEKELYICRLHLFGMILNHVGDYTRKISWRLLPSMEITDEFIKLSAYLYLVNDIV